MLPQLRGLLRNRREIYDDLYEGRQFDALYFVMLVSSCLIALLGLLVGSPAVIIGAMLISPLMGPILASGLALTLADWSLGKKALRNLTLSVVEAIAIAAAATALSPLREVTPEILARTNPNLMDLLIAFFSGVAGTVALASRKEGLTILPGVAIATAVMPPLATSGYGIATAQWGIGAGGFMLFFTNLTAIVISGAAVFLLVGFRPHEEADHLLVRYRILVAAAVLIVVSVPLIRTLLAAVQEAHLRREITSVLRRRLESPGQARVASVDFKASGREVSVETEVHTSRFIPPAEQEQMASLLSERLDRSVRLALRQLRLETQDFSPAVQARPALAPTPRPLAVAVVGEVQKRIQATLGSLLEPGGIQSPEVHALAARDGGTLLVEVVGRSASPSDAAAWSVAAAVLGRETGSRLELSATLAVGEPVLLRFRPGRSEAGEDQAAKLGPLGVRIPAVPGLELAATAAAAADPTLVRRQLAWLRTRLQGVTIAGAPEGDPGVEPDTVRLQVVQRIRVSAPGATEPH